MKKYNKLIRDKIPEIIISKNEKPFTHIANDKEYWQKLKEKLLEEVNEFLIAENYEEMVDILEVIKAINFYKKFDESYLERLRLDKKEKKGGFESKIILDYVE